MKAKSPFASRPIKISIQKGTRGVRTRYDTALLPLDSTPSCGTPVVQSYRSPTNGFLRRCAVLCESGRFPTVFRVAKMVFLANGGLSEGRPSFSSFSRI